MGAVDQAKGVEVEAHLDRHTSVTSKQLHFDASLVGPYETSQAVECLQRNSNSCAKIDAASLISSPQRKAYAPCFRVAAVESTLENNKIKPKHIHSILKTLLSTPPFPECPSFICLRPASAFMYTLLALNTYLWFHWVMLPEQYTLSFPSRLW